MLVYSHSGPDHPILVVGFVAVVVCEGANEHFWGLALLHKRHLPAWVLSIAASGSPHLSAPAPRVSSLPAKRAGDFVRVQSHELALGLRPAKRLLRLSYIEEQLLNLMDSRIAITTDGRSALLDRAAIKQPSLFHSWAAVAWDQHLAELLGFGLRTINGYATGARKIPKLVAVVINLLVRGAITVDQIDAVQWPRMSIFPPSNEGEKMDVVSKIGVEDGARRHRIEAAGLAGAFHRTKEAYATAFEYFKVSRHRLGAHVQDFDFGKAHRALERHRDCQNQL
jgi:hypothetical protein